MKISVVSGILGDYSLEESLKYLSGLGVDEFELGVGGYPGKAHADALVLSKDKKAREAGLSRFRAARVRIRTQRRRPGSPAHGRPITRRRWNGSGTKCSFRIGKRRSGLRRITA